MNPKIMVVGSLNMDLIVQSSHIPAPGETVLGNSFSIAAGGKGANQAVAASRLGAQVTMVGCVGSDHHGRELIQGLHADHVKTQFIRQEPKIPTGVALITVDDHGENSIVVVSGANWHINKVDIDRAADELCTSDVLVLQLETPLEIVEYAIDIAYENHVPVILNPAPAKDLPAELLQKVTYLVPNESEASFLSGVTVKDVESAEGASVKIREKGVRTVVVTRGSAGAYINSVSGSFSVPAIPVIPVDTTAAGDAFVAGLAWGIAMKKPLQEAVRVASAAGALATTKLGAQPSLPGADQVNQLLLKK